MKNDESQYESKEDFLNSLEESIKEMQLMRAGKLPKRTWEEFKVELRDNKGSDDYE